MWMKPIDNPNLIRFGIRVLLKKNIDSCVFNPVQKLYFFYDIYNK